MSKPPRSAPLGLDAATDELHRKPSRTRRPRVASGANALGLDAATDALHRKLLAEALRQNPTLAQAARQLYETDATVTAIAMALGFSSTQYFATAFKRYTRHSPGQAQRRRVHVA